MKRLTKFLDLLSSQIQNKPKPSHLSPTPEANEDSQTTVKSTTWLILLVSGIFSLVALFGEYGVFAKHRLHARRIQLEQEVVNLKEQIKNLYAETQALRTNPQVIEAMARKELGMARPDEIIYILQQEPE